MVLSGLCKRFVVVGYAIQACLDYDGLRSFLLCCWRWQRWWQLCTLDNQTTTGIDRFILAVLCPLGCVLWFWLNLK